MDFDLTDEQRLVRATARAFTDKEIVARARDNARAKRFDLELVGLLAEQGYLGATISAEYGGAGLDHITYGLVVEEIGRGDTAMRTVVSVQTSLVCGSIARWGTDAQKARYLPRLCVGDWLGCFGLTEPDSGSDAASLRTRARKVPGGWRLDGSKMWISLGNHAKVALIFARTDPQRGRHGLGCFLVDTDDPGYHATAIDHKMGLHASDTAAIALDDVFVADEDLLGAIGDGLKIAMSALDGGRFSVAAGCVGICQGCQDASVAYACEREQFGRPIAGFQLVQAMLAEMKVRTDAARLLVQRAGFALDLGRRATTEISIAKLYATEAAVWCANEAIQVHGAAGYTDDHPVERWLRDARVTTLYEGTSQIHQLIIGRALTGIDAMVPGKAHEASGPGV